MRENSTNAASAADQASQSPGHFLLVPFPLSDIDDRRMRLKFQQILEQSPGPDRPTIVLQFVEKMSSERSEDATNARLIGQGTEFERSLALARWLLGPTGVRARTVAYLPESVEGHAVLVALACEEIAMAPLSEMGRASIDEPAADQVVVDGYLSIAKRRGAFPPDAIRSMLDRDATLFKAELVGEKQVFLSASGLKPYQDDGQVISETQLSIPGQLGKFTGQELRSWRWITHLARDDEHLRETLGASSWSVQKRSATTGKLKPALIEMRGVVTRESVNRWMRAIDEARQRDGTNLLILHLHSPGGDLAESLRMAEYLANFDETTIETVAWVDGVARGDAAAIALACDTLLAKPQSILGGPGEASIQVDEVRSLNETWNELARLTDRSPGEFYSLVSPDLDLHEYTHLNGQTEIGDSELFSKREDADDWKQGNRESLTRGIAAEQAVQRKWVAGLAPNLPAVAEQLGIEKLPEPTRVTRLEQWIRSLADQDWLATLLLTLSLALFTNEITTPGLGLAGFLSLLCMSLFFWMKFLDGTVEWLEITLCVGGMLALGLEVFVLPGFGVFGFGGFVMLACGIVLASQTFIVPTNDYQWGRLATSTGQIAVACIGLLTTVYLLRNQLERLPFFRMLRLDPPASAKVSAVQEDWSYLVGSKGRTTARCAPVGKALIGDRYWDVHSPDDLIETDTDVEVIEVRDHTIFVRRVPGNDAVS